MWCSSVQSTTLTAVLFYFAHHKMVSSVTKRLAIFVSCDRNTLLACVAPKNIYYYVGMHLCFFCFDFISVCVFCFLHLCLSPSLVYCYCASILNSPVLNSHCERICFSVDKCWAVFILHFRFSGLFLVFDLFQCLDYKYGYAFVNAVCLFADHGYKFRQWCLDCPW